MHDEKATSEGSWSFHDEETQQTPTSDLSQQHPQETVSWTASEFIANHKSPGWYFALFTATGILSAALFFIVHDIISIVFIIIVSILFATLAGKKPRQLPYQIDSHGITIGGKSYPYGMFKSFSVLHDGPIGYINLLPLKRFMPELSIYFAMEDEQRIVDALASNLPYEHREESPFDRLMKKLHF